MLPGVALAAAAVVGSALASRVAASRRGGLSITWHHMPWSLQRRARVVHVTDIHVGPTTPRSMLEHVSQLVHAQNPDLVVLTGDYVNTSLFFLNSVTDFVRALPKPCIATLGNHDHWTSATRVTGAVEAGGAEVLRNESTTVFIGDEPFVVVGVDDGRTGHANVPRAFRGVTDPGRALVLSHFPRTADAIAETGAPLVLSGHTHAGQVHVPHATRAFAKLTGNPYLHGFYRVGENTDLYVNAGIGHSLAGLRAGRTLPEIAVFELDPSVRTRRSHALRARI